MLKVMHIVFVHGTGGLDPSWGSMPALMRERGHEVDAIAGATIEPYRRHLEDVVRPDSIVVAHSWGSIVASHLRCRLMVLLAPGARVRVLPAWARQALRPGAVALAYGEHALLHMPLPSLHRPFIKTMIEHAHDESAVADFTERMKEVEPRVRAERWLDVVCERAVKPRARSIIVTGTADRVTPLVRVRELAAEWDLEVIELEGIGHCIPLEDPEGLADVIESQAQLAGT